MKAQEIIKKYAEGITLNSVNKIYLDYPEEVGVFFYNPLWESSTPEIYNRYHLNHNSICVHNHSKEFNPARKSYSYLKPI